MRLKNTLIIIWVQLFLLLTTFASAAAAQTDLTMREALYFVGAKSDQIDLKNDPFVAKGGTMQLSTGQAAKCGSGTCDFNIGFIGIRTGNPSAVLSTYGLLQVENGGLFGNTIYFGTSEQAKNGVLPLALKIGLNRVTFTIDPYKKVAETNERNNSFSVTFNVVRSAGRP